MMALASKRPKAFTQALDEDDGKDGLNGGLDTMLCKRVVTKDRRYITQITCFEKGQQHTFGAKAASPATSARSKGKTRNNGNVPSTNGMPAAGTERNALRLPVFGKQQGGGALASLFSLNRQLGRWSVDDGFGRSNRSVGALAFGEGYACFLRLRCHAMLISKDA